MRNVRSGSLSIAKMMIQRHGLHAGAVAQERATEARLSPDIEGLNFWRSVQSAISELRNTAHGARSRRPAGQGHGSAA